MSGIILGLIMALIGGPAMAWATQQKGSLKSFEKRKQAFAEGKGKDPEADMIGPHKGFGHNAKIFGVMFGLIGFAIGFFVG